MTTSATFPIFPAVRAFTPRGCELAPTALLKNLITSAAWRERIDSFFLAAGHPTQSVAVACDDRVLASAPVLASWQPHTAIAPGGYALLIDAQGFALRAADDLGFYAGLQTLWQLAECGRPIPLGEVADRPAVKIRSFQMDLGRQPETPREIKRVLRQQARYRYNQCQLYIENSIKLPCFGDAADPNGLSVEEFTDIQTFAADLGIELVPSLNLLGHMEKLLAHPRFAHLSEMSQGARHSNQQYAGCVCPYLPETRELISAAIAEMAAITRSKWLMLGLDECWTLGSHPLTRPHLDPGGWAGTIFRDWIRFLHAETTRHGKQMWMWEDMLFYHRGSLGQIPSDIGMNAWHYQHIESVPMYSFQNWGRIDSFRLLSDAGHPMMLCCGPAPHHLLSMIRYAQPRPLEGVLVVQWEGKWTVQESSHLDRIIAAGVLWQGDMPDAGAAMRAATGFDAATSDALGDIMVSRICGLPAKSGGSSDCPRFWSWPENALAMIQKQAIHQQRQRVASRHESLDLLDLSIASELASVTADWARENAALVGREMLRNGAKQNDVFDDAVDKLAQAHELASGLVQFSQNIQQRYTDGMSDRHMASLYKSQAGELSNLLDRLRKFQANPTRETWPFPAVSLHIDGLIIDPCAHHLTLKTSNDRAVWTTIYNGGARLGGMEGEFIMSFALTDLPRYVMLDVGGFASLAIMRLRLETLDGTRMPTRVIESAGYCTHPEHLLEYDRKFTTFNPPDVMANWTSMEPPKRNFVMLEY